MIRVALVLAAVAGAAGAARAEPRSPLDGQPAVRRRSLLVSGRLELAPAFESSVSAEFKHTVAGGLKVEVHLSDVWSLGGAGFIGIGLDSGLNRRIAATLDDEVPDGDPTPTRAEWSDHLATMPLHGALYLSATPWFGKLSAFGHGFVSFDGYGSAGVAVARMANHCCSFTTDAMPGGDLARGILPDADPNNDPALNGGTRVGLYLGGGVHLFLSDWLALDLAVRDYLFRDNPSGLDVDADLAVTRADDHLVNHLFVGVGVAIFLPRPVARTD